MRRRLLYTSSAGLAAVAAAALAWGLVPPATGAGVDVSAAGAGRCSDVVVAGVRVRGGCVLTTRGATVAFSAITPFGDHRLARCAVSFQLRIGGSGELALTDLAADDLEDRRSIRRGVSEACGDVLACRRRRGPESYPEPRDKLPWKGRVVASGRRLQAELDACFDTCLGQFAGRLSLKLAERGDRGWSLAASAAPVGEGGLEVAGRWRLEPRVGESLAIEVEDR